MNTMFAICHEGPVYGSRDEIIGSRRIVDTSMTYITPGLPAKLLAMREARYEGNYGDECETFVIHLPTGRRAAQMIPFADEAREPIDWDDIPF